MNSKRKQPERAKFKHPSPEHPELLTLPAVAGASLPRSSPSVHTPAPRSSRRLGRSTVCTRHRIHEPRPPAGWEEPAASRNANSPAAALRCSSRREVTRRPRLSRAGRRLRDRELRTAQSPPPPRVRRARCPEIVPPPAPAPAPAPGSAAPTPRP